MKAVYLIGDSIRFGAPSSPGYGIYVKEGLDGKAEVLSPSENCRFAQYTLRYLHEWSANIDRDNVSVVHWNNGLWDVLRLFDDDIFTPIEFYKDTLLKIHKRIRFLFPNAKIIFATSTAVIEEWARPEFLRRNSEICEYNNAAIEVLSPLGVEINDLYEVTQAFEHDLYSDWVHYTEAGSRILAEKVISKIEKYI